MKIEGLSPVPAILLLVLCQFLPGSAAASDHSKKAHENATPAPRGYDYAHPEVQPARETLDLTMYNRIRDEGFQHSRIMDYASALTDGIGPRLTGSPNMAKANAWTRDTLTAIGLSNAHLEDWGDFGMGWQQINTWARMVSPDPEPLWIAGRTLVARNQRPRHRPDRLTSR